MSDIDDPRLTVNEMDTDVSGATMMDSVEYPTILGGETDKHVVDNTTYFILPTTCETAVPEVSKETSWFVVSKEEKPEPTVLEIFVEADPEEPVEIKDGSFALVNNKMSVLKTNPETGTLFAHPTVERKRGRGRPRKCEDMNSNKCESTDDGVVIQWLTTPEKSQDPDLNIEENTTQHDVLKKKRGRPKSEKPRAPNTLATVSIKTTPGDLEKFRCLKCDHQSYCAKQYEEHLLSFHSDEVFKCKCCNFAAFEEDALVTHYTSVHPKNYCSYCGMTSDKAYVINRHMMRHTQQGCTCDQCGKVFKDMYILKAHIKVVHMPIETMYECNICSKKFSRQAHLTRHMRTHDGGRSFQCPQCNYCGVEKSDVTKHMLVHSEPKFRCDICQKLFRQAKNRNLHVKRHNQQRDYKCGLCDFLGYTFTDIKRHIQRAHKENNKLYCEKCEAIFNSFLEYMEHIKTGNCDLVYVDSHDTASDQSVVLLCESEGALANEEVLVNEGSIGEEVIDSDQIYPSQTEVGNWRNFDSTILTVNENDQLTESERSLVLGDDVTGQVDSPLVEQISYADVVR